MLFEITVKFLNILTGNIIHSREEYVESSEVSKIFKRSTEECVEIIELVKCQS